MDEKVKNSAGEALIHDGEAGIEEAKGDFDEVGENNEKIAENSADIEDKFPTKDEKMGEVVNDATIDSEPGMPSDSESGENEATPDAVGEAEEEGSEKADGSDKKTAEAELLGALMDEIKALRTELDNVRAEAGERAAQYERMNAEYAEFSSLFPDVTLAAVPQSVWNEVGRGVPLAAAYALESRRAAIQRQNADAVNRKNSDASLGALESRADSGFYSPDEVRAMSRGEVRANYSKIIESMKHWH